MLDVLPGRQLSVLPADLPVELLARADRARDLAVRGDEDVRLGAEHHDDVVLADADTRVRAVQDELDLAGLVAQPVGLAQAASASMDSEPSLRSQEK